MRHSIIFALSLLLVAAGGAGVYQLAGDGAKTDTLEHQPMLLSENGASRHIASADHVGENWIGDGESEVELLEPSVDPDDDLPEIDADAPKTDADSGRSKNEPVNNIDPKEKHPGLAVIPFKQSKTIREEDAGLTLANLLLSEIDSARYTLFERGQIAALLEEAKFQESDLVNSTARAVEFGKLAGIRYLVIGELSKLGKIRWTARVIDCQTGEIGEKGSVSLLTFQEIDSVIPEMLAVLKLNDGSVQIGDSPDRSENRSEARKPRRALTGNDLIDAHNPNASFTVQIDTGERKQDYAEGENVSFVITTDADCFLTLVAVDPAGDLTLLMPNRWQHRVFVRAGQTVSLPSAGMNFEFPIQPPHGQTIVKLIATSSPLTIRGIDSQRLDKEGFVNSGNIRDGNKAIGVSGDETQSLAIGDLSTLSERFADHEWATAELVIRSFPSHARNQPNPSKPDPTPPGETDRAPIDGTGKPPLVPDATGEDPNESVRKRWARIISSSQSHSNSIGFSNTDSLNIHENRGAGTMDGLLVIRRDDQVTKSLDSGQGGYSSETVYMPAGSKAIGQNWIGFSEQLKNGDETILAVIPNRRMYAFSPLPPTRLAEMQWGLRNIDNPGFDTAWHKAQHEIPNISKMPVVAVVDQGIDIKDDRVARFAWTNPKEIASNGIDDDENGFVDDVHGYHFAHQSAKLNDPGASSNHGSYVSSIIASQPIGRSDDLVGIAPGVPIMTIGAMKYYPEHGAITGKLSDIFAALQYAADNGARVINMSLGGSTDEAGLGAYNNHPIWDRLENDGILVVIAAGNSDGNNDTDPLVPANLSTLRSNVITVMAIDPAGKRARQYNPIAKSWTPFSNYGKRTVQIAAPGTSILGINGPDGTDVGDGTSYASPIVAGAAALIWGNHPDWDYTMVKRAILETARPVEGFEHLCATGGTLDIQAALQWLP